MNILITGGLGYIGSHIVVELAQQGHRSIIVDNLSSSTIQALFGIEKILGYRPTFHRADVRDPHELRHIFYSEPNIDTVIHLANNKSVSESIQHPDQYYDNNIMSTVNLTRVMSEYDVKHLIFSSSATIYDTDETNLPSEDTLLKATSPYGRTKIIQEQYLHDLATSDPDWSIIILRYFNPIGAHKSGLIGDFISKQTTNIMPLLANATLTQKPLLVYGNSHPTLDGTCVRDFIHINDLTTGHIATLQHRKKGVTVYNLGTGRGTSVNQLINTFEETNNVSVPTTVTDKREGDRPHVVADNTKALINLDWKPTQSLEDMCRDSWNFYQTQK